jgi:hypothetical protein
MASQLIFIVIFRSREINGRRFRGLMAPLVVLAG